MKKRFHRVLRRRAAMLSEAFMYFFRQEASSGIVLLLCAALAMYIANSAWAGAYEHFLHQELGFADGFLSMSLLHWINDGLMAVFFFVIGMEIKREVLFGDLQSLSATVLPICAAIGGMVIPAGMYVLFNIGMPSVGGWGVPMATDIAFALGVLAFAGSGVPRSIAIFLTALAIVDDLGSILVIALFYTSSLQWEALAAGGAVFLMLWILARRGVRSFLPDFIGGILAWYAFWQAGIHPTIAGVLLGFMIPAGTVDTMEEYPLYQLEHRMAPWSAYLIMPIFALGNAGIPLDMSSFNLVLSPIGLGVLFGLCLGKPLGIFFSVYALVRTGFVRLPSGLGLRHFAGAGILGGIGFTMSLFIASLAFSGVQELTAAKLGIVMASLLSGLAGILVFQWIGRHDRQMAK